MVTTVTDNSPQSINTSLFSLDKEVQEIKKVTDKLSGVNPESNVISVNGKQGIVELNASDVNALPDTTVIPTTTSELENTSGFITSSDSITGNAATATRAEQDANGNVITDTYATKELIANETSERKTADEALQTQITANKNAIDTLNGTGTGSVKKTVTDEIAKVVANAPEDFDTLKEISDWIDTHEDSASAMNTQIQTNKNEIASLKTEVAGKSDIGHTHSASDITSGTLPIARGGTGATTAKDAFVNIANGLLEGAGPEDTEHMIFQNSSGKDWGRYKFYQFWEYIKGKISSVLGLTASNYGGKASTAGTADSANALTHRGFIQNTDTFQPIMNNDGKWMINDLNPDWHGSLYTLNAGGSQSGLMFRIVGGTDGSNPVQMNYSIDGNRFGMNWATIINSGNIGAQTVARATQDGNGNVITSTYLPRSGGAMTGDIQYKGSKSTDSMIKFIDNTNDAYGNGISIGGRGATIIGGGESSDVLRNTLTSGSDELMMIGNDTNVEIWTNLQDGIASGKKFTFGVDGNITTPLGTVALKSELENTFQDHLIGYIRNKPIYRKVILDSTGYNVTSADILLIDLGHSNRKFIGSGGYVKYDINGVDYRIYPINSKKCDVEIFDQDGFVFLESSIVGKNIDIYAWIDYMQY